MPTYSERARRIVDRVMSRPLANVHGFYEPKAFALSCRYDSVRARLYWRTLARLRAKAEGGAPYLDCPRGMEGTALHAVAAELRGEAA